MTATAPPLFGPDMLTDPYAKYAQIRGPASWNDQMGLWLLTRYEDVRWALGEPRLSSTMPPLPQTPRSALPICSQTCTPSSNPVLS